MLDCLHETAPPFDPAVATQEIAATLKAYGVGKVIGDRYAAQWPVAEFSRNDISYEHSERDRSAVYADFLPLLTAGGRGFSTVRGSSASSAIWSGAPRRWGATGSTIRRVRMTT